MQDIPMAIIERVKAIAGDGFWQVEGKAHLIDWPDFKANMMGHIDSGARTFTVRVKGQSAVFTEKDSIDDVRSWLDSVDGGE